MMETDLTLGTELAEFELFDENWASWTEIYLRIDDSIFALRNK